MNQPVMAASLCLELGNALKVRVKWFTCIKKSLTIFFYFDWHVNLNLFLWYQQEMNRPGEAIVHYQRAAELQTQTPIEALLSMGEMATCKILTRESHLLMQTCFSCSCVVAWFSAAWTHLFCFHRWLRWCSVSVHRDAADVSGERTAASRHQHTCWLVPVFTHRLCLLCRIWCMNRAKKKRSQNVVILRKGSVTYCLQLLYLIPLMELIFL